MPKAKPFGKEMILAAMAKSLINLENPPLANGKSVCFSMMN